MKTKHILAIACSVLALSSCSDFLDVQPEGNPTKDNYFTNDDQAVDAIDGLYAPIHQEGLFGREMFWEQGAACDIVWGRPRGFNTLATFNYTGDEDPLKGTFDRLYNVMSRSNFVIEKLVEKEKTTALSAVEKRSLGEAYFMRAFSHFYIAYRYGTKDQGVPFVRYEDYGGNYDESTIPPQQKSVIDNYKYIIEDLDKAISYLPKFEDYTADDQGRAHKAAAVAYKAKVYAYWATWDKSQWENVIKMVDELETTYGRDLAPSLSTVFSSEYSDFWTKEYLFGIAGNGGATGGGSEFPGVILENKGWGIYNGWGQIKPSYDIYAEMEKDGEGNARLKQAILAYGDEFQFFGKTRRFFSSSDTEAGFQINKYMDAFKHENATEEGYVNANGNWPTTRVNFPLIRFAEMLLFRAEAYLNIGGEANAQKATADINRIRVRSGLKPITGRNATMTDLYHERRCELAFEFTDHLYDLKRWHLSGNAEIKALAEKELNSHPQVRHYTDRTNPDSKFTIGDYEDYQNKNKYDDHMIVFPYPSVVITKSGGKLKQNAGY